MIAHIFQNRGAVNVANELVEAGFSVIPCEGKRPAIAWKKYQDTRPTYSQVTEWFIDGSKNLGIVCGRVSGGLVVVDLDGEDAVQAFYQRFPELKEETLTIATGSGRGQHLYFYVDDLPDNLNVRTDAGGFEIRANGCYVVAPPSIHPDSQLPYCVLHGADIQKRTNVLEIVLWFQSLKKKQERSTKNNAPGSLENSGKDKANHKSWSEAALVAEVENVRQAANGERNNTLNRAAFALGQIVAGGGLDRGAVVSALLDAAADLVAEDGERLVLKTINSGLESGMKQPRQRPENGHRANGSHQPDTFPHKPDDDQLSIEIAKDWRQKVAYFHHDWRVYSGGFWELRHPQEVKRKIRQKLRDYRRYGVSVTQSRVNAILGMLEDDLFIADREISRRQRNAGEYINLRNGLFNLDTLKLEPHEPDLMFTHQLGFDYDPEADCPYWLRFTRTSLVKKDNSPDWQLIQFLQEAMGYSLTARTDYKASFWLIGKPDSGKSTLIALLRDMAGDMQLTIDLNQLSGNRFLLAEMPGKRIVTFTEGESATALPDAIYKAITGGQDELWVDVKNRPGISFVPTAKIWWAMNDVPKVFDRSGATFKRLKPVLFNRTIPPDQRIQNLPALLRREIPGIFAWAMEGYHRLKLAGKFTQVDQADAWIEQYQHDSDTELCFVEDECEVHPDYSVQSRPLYQRYKQYCYEYGFRHKSITQVAREWERLGFQKGATHGRVFWRGLKLKDNTGV